MFQSIIHPMFLFFHKRPWRRGPKFRKSPKVRAQLPFPESFFINMLSHFYPSDIHRRDLKQTSTATATWKGQNLLKITKITKNLRGLRTGTPTAIICVSIPNSTLPAISVLTLRCGTVRDAKHIKSFAKF